MANEKLTISLIADNTKAIRSVQEFADSASKSISRVFNALQAVAAVVLVGKGFKEIIDGAIESEQAITQLNTALKLSGSFSEETSQNFQDFANNLQKTANISDEVVLGFVAQAKALGKTNEEAKLLVTTSTDVAAVLGTDVTTSFNELSNTLNGVVSKSLKARFPEIKQLTQAQLANGEAIELLAARYKGAAGEIQNTFGGAATGVSIAFGEIFESIGKLITQNPAIVAALNIVKNAFFDLADFISNNTPAAIAAFNSAIGTIATAVINLERQFAPVLAVIVDIGKLAFNVFSLIFSQSISTAISLVKGLAGAFEFLLPALNAVLAGIKIVLVGILESIRKVVAGIESLSGKDFGSAKIQATIDKIVESTFKQEDAIRDTTEAINDSADAQQDFITKLLETQKAQSQILNTAIEISKVPPPATKAEVSAAASNPSSLIGKAASGESIKSGEGIGAAAGVLNEALKGQAGAAKLISSSLGAIADTILPGVGGVVSEIAGVLAQGPEAAAGFIKGFLDAIPTIVENIILAIPAVIEALIEGIPRVINSLIEKLPNIINELVRSLPGIAIKFALSLANQSGLIAVKFTVELIKNIPTMVKAFVEEIGKQISSLGGLLGGGGGGIFGGGGFLGLGFAQGGMVPPGFPGDTFPARLSSGEFVVDRSLTAELTDLVARSKQGGTVAGAQNVTINLVVGEEQLASVLVNLNKQGFRTS